MQAMGMKHCLPRSDRWDPRLPRHYDRSTDCGCRWDLIAVFQAPVELLPYLPRKEAHRLRYYPHPQTLHQHSSYWMQMGQMGKMLCSLLCFLLRESPYPPHSLPLPETSPTLHETQTECTISATKKKGSHTTLLRPKHPPMKMAANKMPQYLIRKKNQTIVLQWWRLTRRQQHRQKK